MARTMLGLAVNMHRGSRFVALGWLLPVALLAPAVARGQTTTTGPVITPASTGIPDRILADGVTDVGTSTRSQNLNPLGINFADCSSDLKLRFQLLLSGFGGTGDSFQVWASNTTDCTTPASRGQGGVAPVCWELFEQAGINNTSSSPETVTVNVRDIVGPLNGVPSVGLAGTRARGEGLGVGACYTQPTFTAVPMYLFFMAINSAGTMDGTDFQYGTSTLPFSVDLIGPPAPTGVTKAVGDTLFIINWVANADSDTAGYDVFIDPPIGHEDAGNGVITVQVCPDSGTSTTPTTSAADADDGTSDDGDDASVDATVDASSDAAVSSTSDSGCYSSNQTGPSIGPGATCSDSIFTSSLVQDGGSVVSTPILDSDGDIIDASVSGGNGGLSNIPAANLVGANVDGVTVSDKSGGTFTITGLTNNFYYSVAVAAVDGSGNVGPVTSPVCDFPAPVNDFWTLYKNAGGGAGGGLCALEQTGEPVPATTGIAILIGATAIGLQRRRARKQRLGGHDERTGL